MAFAFSVVTLLKSVNFGSGQASLETVGYTLIDTDGSEAVARSTEGVHEVGTDTGIYATNISFPTTFTQGSILWDTGTDPNFFATEQYNSAENVSSMLDWTGGRWELNSTDKMMIFYQEDNTDVIARFSLFDRNGNPDLDEVYNRVRNDETLGGPYFKTNPDGTTQPYTLSELLAAIVAGA